MNMPQLRTLFQRELWEYKGILFWVPIVLAAFLVVIPLIHASFSDHVRIGLEQFAQLAAYAEQNTDLNRVFYVMLNGLFVPFMMLAMIIQLYYFTVCLFDERRDRSILFWRSLPVSDMTAVGVKFVTGAIVIPGVFLAAATALALVAMMLALFATVILSVGYDVSLWAAWGQFNILAAFAAVWASILPYSLWMAPVFAYLMLASMYAKKAPFLWVILPVAAVLVTEGLLVQYFGLEKHYVAMFLGDFISITKHDLHGNVGNDTSLYLKMFGVLASKINLPALVVAAGMLYATLWLRKNRTEI